MSLLNIITSLHTSTRRNYLPRMIDEKVKCMKVARKYGKEYWDGDRRYGYGGYVYDGRWKKAAQKLIQRYKLKSNAKILDVGCGKAHLVYELIKLLPDAQVLGMDISKYGIRHAPKPVRNSLMIHKAQDKYPYKDQEFDLVISLNTLHNLKIYELKTALSEIERVGKNKFITMESYRNESELFNLQCWALTCESFFEVSEWIWIFCHFGYTGDFEFIYFE